MNSGIPPAGFRLPAETTVGRVGLQVTDLDRSVLFYNRLLGFDVLDQTPETARLGVGDTTLIELRGGASRPHAQRRLGLYHFAILLPDRPALGAALRTLLAHGVHPGASDHLVSEALYIHDPDGLGIEIYRDRPRNEWREQGQEIAMASNPLDFESVLGAGESHDWKGIPEGTRIGHIHLHVGDLEKARGFYHQGLGFDVMVQSYPGALFMAAGGYHHHLGVNTWTGPNAEPSPADEARLLYWDLEVPTGAVEAAGESLAEAAYGVTREGDGKVVVPDPWGTIVRIRGSN